jgi:hypothetical protein
VPVSTISLISSAKSLLMPEVVNTSAVALMNSR